MTVFCDNYGCLYIDEGFCDCDNLNIVGGVCNGSYHGGRNATDNEPDCIKDKSRWYELFGTPENAARTIMHKQLTYDLLEQCDECPHQTDECFEPRGKCAMDDYDTLLEWLRGDA